MMKKIVTYVGTYDDDTTVITQHGVTFTKNVSQVVEAEEFAPFWEGNPTFSVDEMDSNETVEDEEAEKEVLRSALDSADIQYRKNASVEALRKLVQDNIK